MIYELPKPKSPETFENLVCDIANSLYKTTSFNLYGRKGQKQKGIDIISFDLNTIIQCKLRSLNINKRETKLNFINEIIKDINNIFSNGFKPSKIIIATTIENDTTIQDYLNTTLLFNNIGCTIEFWSWTKISSEMFLFKNIVNKYYSYRDDSIELARIEVLNKSIYQKSKTHERLYEFKNIKNKNQLPIFDFSFINNSDKTILLNSIECFCEMLPVARAGFAPKPNGILKPTKKFLIDFNFNLSLTNDKPDIQYIEIENPIYVYPNSPLRIQIQNKKPLINFYKIYFIFRFNDIDIKTPELFFNSHQTYSGKIVTEISV
ncbi:hypothetical protein KRX57_00245 [Weeksellaceae bacterium TAE3-ERU29]|nr:hypothetical protein [Weeksellaceae bacterium TAE3-ERU29]